MKKLIPVLLAALILGGSGVAALKIHQSAPTEAREEEHEEEAPAREVEAVTVHRGSLEDALRVTGTLQPLPEGEAKVAAQVSGRLERVFVRTGQRVKAGELLATVSRTDLQALAQQSEAGVREAEREVDALRAERETRARNLPLQEQKAEADLAAAEAHLALLRAGSRPEEVERAEAAVQAEQAELDRLRAGSRPQEVAQAEAAVRDARANRDALQKDAARKRSLYEKGIVAAKEAERAEADLAAGQANLEQKEQALSLAKAGSRPEEIRAQENRVKEAQAQLRQARAGNRPEEIREAEAALIGARTAVEQARASRAELRALDDRIASARARVDAARQQTRAARVTAGRTEIRAPIAGVVTQLLARSGEGVSEQSPVAQILNTTAYRAVLEIPASHRAEAQPGTPVEVRVPGLAGSRFNGSIRTLLAAANTETGFLPAEVWISDPQHRLAQGMAVDAVLRRSHAGSGLFVPSRALFAREGEQYVYVIRGDEAHEQAVEVGIERGEETEITKGLREGDRVVRDGSLSLADGAKVTVAP